MVAKGALLSIGASSMDQRIKGVGGKVKLGLSWLDDNLFEGAPPGSQILLSGPEFIGKEFLPYHFLWRGMNLGEAGIVLTTASSPQDMRDRLKAMAPRLEKFEEYHLLFFIDARPDESGDDATAGGNFIKVNGPGDLEGIERALKTICETGKFAMKKRRLVISELSFWMTIQGFENIFKFIQRLTGKFKAEEVVALYLLNPGYLDEKEAQATEHLMDGTIRFKTEKDKQYMKVEGICDVKDRRWKEYRFSKKGLEIEEEITLIFN